MEHMKYIFSCICIESFYKVKTREDNVNVLQTFFIFTFQTTWKYLCQSSLYNSQKYIEVCGCSVTTYEEVQVMVLFTPRNNIPLFITIVSISLYGIFFSFINKNKILYILKKLVWHWYNIPALPALAQYGHTSSFIYVLVYFSLR